MSPSPSRQYRPWIKEDYLWPAAWLAAGLLLLILAWHYRAAEGMGGVPAYFWLGVPGVAAVAFALRRMKRGRARSYGKSLEGAAVRDLQSGLPAGWSTRTGVMTSRGDVDLWLSAEGKPFAVEIKSHANVRIRFILFFFWPSLRHRDGRPFAPGAAALDQTKAIAREAGAAPVLWFPAAYGGGCHAVMRGALVVLGGHRALIKAVRRKGPNLQGHR